jgi:hypothetical protein
MTLRKGHEETEAEAKAIVREYREQRVNLVEPERTKARDKAIYRLKQLGRTAGYALRELEGKPR